MEIEVGKKYYRKRSVCGTVRQVLGICDTRVDYRVLHGPALERKPFNSCGLHHFKQWADGEFIGDDYRRLDGAMLHRTYIVQNVAGEPIFRCGLRRKRFYLKKGFAIQLDDDTLRFIDDTTERKLKELYAEGLSPFFMEVKNDRCVVCGKDHNLTRHHVVPQRHKRKIPIEMRRRISNILFVCVECHHHYETQQLVSDSIDPYVSRDHFVETMNPQFMPVGWDIVLSVRTEKTTV
jgi:hypothetical protein